MNLLSKVSIALFFLALFSCGDGQIIAVVGKEKIALSDFTERCQKKAQLIGQESLTAEQKQEVLNSMIQREIVYLHAQKTGEKVPDTAFDEATGSLSFFSKLRHKKEIEKNLLFKQMKEKIEGTIDVSKEEIEMYYGGHKDEFTQPVLYKVYLVTVERKDVDHVLMKLEKRPEAFDDMALKRVSPELRDINTNAQFTPKNAFPEEMWPFLEKMNKGEIAGPVDFERGTFLFKLVDKRPAGLLPLKEVYEKIDLQLTYKKREEAFEKWYQEIKDEFRVEIKSGMLS